MGINMSEILEYVNFVDPILPAIEVPKIPIPKESHFNFLKPGSKEVLTRPVHIHEHLPPLNPPEEETLYTNGEKEIDVVGFGLNGDDIFKRPAENACENPTAKKAKSEEEGRATREISSVMMTTSGFISPAREGKLPETRPPKLPEEFPKPIPPPMISPPFKSSKDIVGGSSGLSDKKLEKKLKKKEKHEKERKKEKHTKERFSMPDPNELEVFNPPATSAQTIPIPREANEEMLNAERKKELKKLKMKNKEEKEKKKKEKPPKIPKNSQIFDPSFLDMVKPFQVLPQTLPQPPPASSQVQAHNFLTGAAHSGLFLDQSNIFNNLQNQSLLSTQNPLIEGKLVTEPDKNKLNIFKKIQRPPKEELIKDFLSPSKFDQFQQPSSSQQQQIYTDPMKKIPKLPKETTLTRIEDTPMNLSGMREFDEIPKTPTIPRTPEIVPNVIAEKKEKKERKKKEKKLDQQMDWSHQQQQFTNPFDLSAAAQNNSFLQSISSNLLNNPFLNPSGRNPFTNAADIFSPGPGLIPRSVPQFGMSAAAAAAMVNPYGFPLPNMEMNIMQQQQQHQQHSPSIQQKKVKQPKQSQSVDFLQMGSKLCNVPSLMPPSSSLNLKERSFEAPPSSHSQIQQIHSQTSSNISSNFPSLQQSSASFDQLLKDQQTSKKVNDEKVETFDLTKDSSPEPLMTAPIPSTPLVASNIAPLLDIPPQSTIPSTSFQQEVAPPPSSSLPMSIDQVPVIKEKSKEKKKKKDKDKERDKDKEERKKVKKNYKFKEYALIYVINLN